MPDTLEESLSLKPLIEPPGFGDHEIWNLCILMGAGIHYMVFLLYMLPSA